MLGRTPDRSPTRRTGDAFPAHPEARLRRPVTVSADGAEPAAIGTSPADQWALARSRRATA